MSFDFPSPGTEGLAYNPAGGPQYVYTNGAWRMLGNPTQLATAETRSRIVNGAMQISQENGNTLLTASDQYPADQWSHTYTSTGVLKIQRVQVTTPNGSANRLRCTVTTADTSIATGEVAQIRHAIEGIRVADFLYGTAAAKQVVLRFGWKSPAGTWSICLRNAAANRSYVASFTIAAGQADTDTTQIFVIPGDVTGTWLIDTGIGIDLRFVLAVGATWQGVAGWQSGFFLGTSANSNGLASLSNVFELFDVSLHLDPDRTGVPPKWQMPDEAEELRACMRYYERVPVTASSTVANLFPAAGYSARKRTAPAITVAAGTAGTSTWAGLAQDATWGLRQTASHASATDLLLAANARM